MMGGTPLSLSSVFLVLLLLLEDKQSGATSESEGESESTTMDPAAAARAGAKAANQTAHNVTFLLNNLLQQYDNSLRPDIRGPPLVVEINMQVRSMGPISEIDMSYSMDCYFRQSWVDRRLAFSGQKNLALSIEMLRKIWKPDTYIFNGRKSYLHTITTPNKFMRLFPNGRVLYSQRLTIRASCQMDLSDFPMDKQNCPLYIGSFGYSEEDVLYRWTKGRGVNIASDMKLSQFDLIQTPTGNATTHVNKGIHSTLVVGFLLQRHMGNFVIQVYGPCVLLVVISWVSFWLNREATSDRISLGVTTVLTMTFLGLEARTDLPQVAYPTALDYFVFISFMFIFSTVVQFALVHYFTKLGSGEYYLEELEHTICMAELARKKALARSNMLANEDSQNVSTEDEVSYMGSTNVFKAPSTPYNNYSILDEGGLTMLDHTDLLEMGSHTQTNGQNSRHTHRPTQTPSPAGTGAVFSDEHKSFIKHNCLNHHPYGTFYYNKKSGRTGRHLGHPVPIPRVPSQGHEHAINNHHHTVMAGRIESNGPNYISGPIKMKKYDFAHDLADADRHSALRGQAQAHAYKGATSRKDTRNLSCSSGRLWEWAKSWSRYKSKVNLNISDSNTSDDCWCKRCITRAMNNPEKALNSVSKIDKISRIVFPLAFVLLNCFYWYSYLKHSERIDLSFES